jgi:ornithine cyclodeaminase/alanine dehydrogenase-like protein (mu-crystallin family)
MFGGVDWIHITQNKDRLRALVNAVINLLIPQNSGISCLADRTICLSIRTAPWS